MDQMLDGGFVAKSNSLKAKPSILCLDAQMNGKFFSRVDKDRCTQYLGTYEGGFDPQTGP
jgi:hypothetical protein